MGWGLTGVDEWIQREMCVFFVNGSLLLMAIFSSCSDRVTYEDNMVI